MRRYGLAYLLVAAALGQFGRSEAAATVRVAAGTDRAAEETWQIDAARSEVAFSLRHFTTTARGRFNAWTGTITLPSNNWNEAVVDVAIQAASIDTKDRRRDDHLRNSDFFDVEKYPVITFKSTGITRTGDRLVVAGHLTMKGVTKPIVLKGKFLGATRGPAPRLNFQATTTINRLDYGVSYNRLLEKGTMLGDDVTITVTIAAVRH